MHPLDRDEPCFAWHPFLPDRAPVAAERLGEFRGYLGWAPPHGSSAEVPTDTTRYLGRVATSNIADSEIGMPT